MRVVVVGGGVAGSTAAIALRRIGAEVTVLEAYVDPAGQVGSFLSLAYNGLSAVDELGCLGVVQAAGFAVPRQRMWSGRGELLADVPRARRAASTRSSITMLRADLVRTLRQAALDAGATIHTGHRAGALADDALMSEADLIVGADGLWSMIRDSLDPNAPTPAYAGLMSVSGFAARGTDQHTEQDGSFNMVFGRQATFIHLPAPDGRVWWSAQIGGPDRGAVDLTQLVRTFDAEPTVRSILDRATDELTIAAHHTLAPLPHPIDRRTVLIGDAVHPVGAGQGASMAIEDAVVLADELRSAPDVATGLRTYVDRRRPRTEQLMKM